LFVLYFIMLLMKERILKLGRGLFIPPFFAEDEKKQVYGQIYEILRIQVLSIIIIGIVLSILIPAFIRYWLALTFSTIVIGLALLNLARRGCTYLTSLLLVAELWAIITVFAWMAAGIGARAAWGYFIIVFIAGMLLGRIAGIITAGICSLTTLAIAFLSPAHSPYPIQFWLTNTLYLVFVIFLQFLASRSIREALAKTGSELRERLLAQAALFESERKHREMVNSLPFCVFEADLRGILTFVNQTALDWFGYSKDNILAGLNILNIISDTDKQRARESISRIGSGQEVSFHEYQVKRRDGSQFTALIKTQRIFENGAAVGLQGSLIDITERKQGEKKLLESEQRYRSLFEAASDSIFVMKDNLFFDCNSKTLEMLGCRRDQIIGFSPYRFSPPLQPDGRNSQEKALEKINAAYSGTPQFFEWLHCKADNTPFMTYVSLSRFELDSGPHLLAIVRDITDSKMLEEQLRQAQKMEAVGILAGGIAHDFNNILSTIVGYTSLLHMQAGLDTKLKEYLERILAAAERAASLTNSLLAFSRKQVIELQPIDINDSIFGFHKVLARLIGEDIDFKLSLASESLVVDADIRQIEQVLMNLATNSRDAMPHGGKLTITTSSMVVENGKGEMPSGAYAVISVFDTGTGMDNEIQSHLFEPFYTTKEVGKGTGLGLAIVYGIVKNHQGFIKMESKFAQGTTFHIYLPLKPQTIQKNRRKLPPKRL
jgi:two-component system cell cycle sensor histidine kinase/response regulator CckA